MTKYDNGIVEEGYNCNIECYCQPNATQQFIEDHKKNYNTNKQLEIVDVESGFVIPVSKSNEKIIVNGVNYTALYGACTDQHFEFVKMSQAFIKCEKKGFFLGINPKLKNNRYNYIDEEVIYIGNIRPEISHFCLEVLSRLWFIKQNTNKNLKYVCILQNLEEIPNYFMYLLSKFNINEKNLIIVKEITQFKKLTIPEQSFKMELEYNKEFIDVLETIKIGIKAKNYKKVYFAKLPERSIGEDIAIKLFEQNGYKVFLPENLTMEEKISILMGCEDFVAQRGSNALYSMFLKDNAKLTMLNRSAGGPFSEQTQINQIKHLQVRYIDCYCDILPVWPSTGPFVFEHTKYLEDFLKQQNFKYQIEMLLKSKDRNRIKFIKQWNSIYQKETRALYMIENEFNIMNILPSNFIEIVRLLNTPKKKRFLDFFKLKENKKWS